ncbi:MAG TPA: hypothetical protein VFL95_07695, partial [Gemmatimonadales bacterium]|nr:hypothetical protein [Gemmatimonadales bacterium]
MPQHFRLDRAAAALYLGLLMGGCSGGAPVLVPSAATTVDPEQVSEWVRQTTPAGHQLLRFQWQYRDGRGAAVGGRGSARIAGPDSLRFDVAGPFGAGAGAAVVVGDAAVWTEPPDIIRRMVPSYPLLWALFAVARDPAPGADLRGSTDGSTVAWQYIRGADTVAYRRTEDSPGRFLAEVRQRGELVGTVETTLDGAGHPARA